MPVIRISDTTWLRLKKWAEPLEDTAEDAIKKILDKAEGISIKTEMRIITPTSPVLGTTNQRNRRSGSRLPFGLRTPTEAFRYPILHALSEMGGKGRTIEVLNIVGKKMRTVLKQVDYQKISTGQIRWQNAAQWERQNMVYEGLLEPTSSSGRGIWKLTEKGYEALSKNQ
jgi:hypothetical protein